LSAGIYGEPASAMRMIGVTGTQGKTTVTRLIEAGLTRSGRSAAVVGTLGTRVAGVDLDTALTTPEAPDLHGLFALMRERGVTACAVEVSSHALVLGRVDGIVFDVAVFCNLGRDHLDFHHSVEDYYQAKASLFTPARTRLGLVNTGDEYGRRLAAEATVPIRTFALGGATGAVGTGRPADWRAEDVALGPRGSTFVIVAPDGGRIAAACPLPGEFNVANTLAAVAAVGEAGLDPAAAAAGIAMARPVPGRLERIEPPGGGRDGVTSRASRPEAAATRRKGCRTCWSRRWPCSSSGSRWSLPRLPSSSRSTGSIRLTRRPGSTASATSAASSPTTSS
jgi:UDP-N-acetylmuramoyl-L-alanyl-D-glutamate--2,6-diaminopimelate ligase